MAYLIEQFNTLRTILFNRGICEMSSNFALLLKCDVINYFVKVASYISSDNSTLVNDLIDRIIRLSNIINQIYHETQYSVSISTLNNLQYDLFLFLRQIKRCGRCKSTSFELWYSSCINDYKNKNAAYKDWIQIKTRRNKLLNLENLPTTENMKFQMQISKFKHICLTKYSGPGMQFVRRNKHKKVK